MVIARDHVGVQLQLSNYNFSQLDSCNWTPLLYTRQSINYTKIGSYVAFFIAKMKENLPSVWNWKKCSHTFKS